MARKEQIECPAIIFEVSEDIRRARNRFRISHSKKALLLMKNFQCSSIILKAFQF